MPNVYVKNPKSGHWIVTVQNVRNPCKPSQSLWNLIRLKVVLYKIYKGLTKCAKICSWVFPVCLRCSYISLYIRRIQNLIPLKGQKIFFSRGAGFPHTPGLDVWDSKGPEPPPRQAAFHFLGVSKLFIVYIFRNLGFLTFYMFLNVLDKAFKSGFGSF